VAESPAQKTGADKAVSACEETKLETTTEHPVKKLTRCRRKAQTAKAAKSAHQHSHPETNNQKAPCATATTTENWRKKPPKNKPITYAITRNPP